MRPSDEYPEGYKQAIGVALIIGALSGGIVGFISGASLMAMVK